MKTIAFYNQKGGVGKTSLAVNFAYLSARAGNRTLLWDLDPQASATYILRVDNKLAPRTKALLNKKVELEELAVRSNFANLLVVPASVQLRLLSEKIFGDDKGSGAIERAARSAKGAFDTIVIDAPPSLNSLSDSVLAAIDLVCIPLQPSALAIHSLEALAEHLEHLSLAQKSLAVYNMVDMRRIAHRSAIGASKSISRIPLLETFLPYSADVERMATERTPIFELSTRSKVLPAFEALYDAISARLTKKTTKS